MPRNGSGTYTLPLANVVDGTAIEASWANTTLADIATALTDSIDKDGQTVWTGVDDHNGNEIILDADGDTSITADTDDRIDFKIGGSDVLNMSATVGTNLQNLASGQMGLRNEAVTFAGAMFDNIGPTSVLYTRYVVELNNVVLSADGYLVFQFAVAGTYDTGANYDYAITENGGAVTAVSATTAIPLSTTAIGAAANEDGISGTIIFDFPSGTSKWKRMRWTAAFRSAAGALINVQGVGEWKNTAAALNIGILASNVTTGYSGTVSMDSGFMRIYQVL